MKYKILLVLLAATIGCAGSANIHQKSKSESAVYILRKIDTIAVKACGLNGPRTPVNGLDFAPLIKSMGSGCESMENRSFQLLQTDDAKSIFDYRPVLPTCYVILDMHGERGEFLVAHPGGVQYGCIRHEQNVWRLDFGTIIQE